jgi:hypothetical protein
MIRHIVRLIFTISLLACSTTYAACQCTDMADIKNRLLEANTAVAAYSREMQKMMEQIMRTKEPLAYTPERRAKLQGRVQEALNTAMAGKQPTAPSVAGETPGGTSNICTITINLQPSTSACIRESVTLHEQYHQAQCLKTLSAGTVVGSIASGKDRFQRDDTPLPGYAQEEIGGYMTEIQFLQAELARLAQSDECKPKRPKPELRDYTAQPRR